LHGAPMSSTWLACVPQSITSESVLASLSNQSYRRTCAKVLGHLQVSMHAVLKVVQWWIESVRPELCVTEVGLLFMQMPHVEHFRYLVGLRWNLSYASDNHTLCIKHASDSCKTFDYITSDVSSEYGS
jgi:hypothetical protein